MMVLVVIWVELQHVPASSDRHESQIFWAPDLLSLLIAVKLRPFD